MPLLNPGLKIRSRSDNEYEIIKPIAHGGQAEIYLVQSGQKQMVLKVYFKEWATPLQKSIIKRLIEFESPSPYFVWPLDFVEFDDISSFGFISKYVKLDDYFSLESKRFEEEGIHFHNDITSAILIADSLFRLHVRGLCYADISGTNIAINRTSGSVRIFDTDNILFNGEAGMVGGTLPFKAPELITGKTIYPSADTDRYSLSVALFLLLFRIHPFNGKKYSQLPFVEEEEMKRLYGYKPVFIFDPNNEENRPDDPDVDEQRIANILWNAYPDYIKNLMIVTFTKGLQDPNVRSREMTWRHALMKLRDSIVRCPSCQTENFFPTESINCKCWNCANQIITPPMIKIIGPGFNHTIVLKEGSEICKGHLDNSYELRNKVGQIEKTDKCKNLGLKNISSVPWKYKITSGGAGFTPPSKGVCVTDKVTIQFSKDVAGMFIT